MPIVITKRGQDARKINPTPITQEEYLQKYIHDNPDTIPLDDVREDIRLLVLAREFPTTSGPIDALAIDDEGAIFIIETKLYKNPDKRLVVAQVLDYGAALWNNYRDFAEMERILDETINRTFGMTFGQKVKDFFGLNDEDFIDLLNRFKLDLSSGRFTFIVLMDHLHDQLKDLISFINLNSRFNLLGCEMEFYKYEDYEILIPKLYGTEAKESLAASPTSPGRRKWDERTFFEDIKARLDESTQQSIRKLYQHARGTADQISWGTGASRGSFNPKYERISVRSIFTLFSDGVLQINFGWLNDNESTLEFRKQLKDRLVSTAGLAFPPDYEEKYIGLQASQWVNSAREIVETLDELIREASNKSMNHDKQ